MRKYTLASKDARSNVDLREYQSVIQKAVKEIMPAASVTVEKDCYYVSPTPKQGDAVRIGRLICKSALSRQCVFIAKLFSSIEVETKEKSVNEARK